ncbi:MAG: hypothetical protein U5L45_08430 [Saprospiraceae bacterium]|nr:hypothetical protein [Saprospiraceae bacterium]
MWFIFWAKPKNEPHSPLLRAKSVYIPNTFGRAIDPKLIFRT